MKTAAAIVLAAANLVAGHATFQSFVINGKDQGQHFAVQVPANGNNPITDVTSTAMVCNNGKATTDQVEVAAGSSLTFQWHHNDPATVSGDSDEPIAAVSWMENIPCVQTLTYTLVPQGSHHGLHRPR